MYMYKKIVIASNQGEFIVSNNLSVLLTKKKEKERKL